VIDFLLGTLTGFVAGYAAWATLSNIARKRQIARWAAQRDVPRPMSLQERMAAMRPEIEPEKGEAA
jgi:hypothetical protein